MHTYSTFYAGGTGERRMRCETIGKEVRRESELAGRIERFGEGRRGLGMQREISSCGADEVGHGFLKSGEAAIGGIRRNFCCVPVPNCLVRIPIGTFRRLDRDLFLFANRMQRSRYGSASVRWRSSSIWMRIPFRPTWSGLRRRTSCSQSAASR